MNVTGGYNTQLAATDTGQCNRLVSTYMYVCTYMPQVAATNRSRPLTGGCAVVSG